MPRLYAALIRHGDYHQPPGVPSALLPHPLTERGVTQARELGQALAARERGGGGRIAAVIDTSPLRRAWETAELIAQTLEKTLGRPFATASFDALTERSLGALANLTVPAIEAILGDDPRHPPPPADWKSRSTYRAPVIGAESLLQAGARVATHLAGRLDPLADDLAEDTLKLFIGHGASLRHAALCLGVLRLEELPRLSMHHCRPVFFERCGPCDLRHVDGKWKLRRRGEAPRD